jgi:hypothetical protein
MAHEHSHDGDHHHGHHDHPHEHHEDRHESEEHSLTDIDKLKLLLPYLIDHNRDHAEELKEWREKVKDKGIDGLTEELIEVIHLSDRIVEHLTRALGKLGHPRA